MVYVLNPQSAQDSIEVYLQAEYPHLPVIADGLLDQEDYIPAGATTPVNLPVFSDGSIKPFIILRFQAPRRARRGRSIQSHKLDSYTGSVDVVTVARNGSECRRLSNDIGDTLTDWKPENAGRVFGGEAIWEPSVATIDNNSKPERWAANNRYHFPIQANHTI